MDKKRVLMVIAPQQFRDEELLEPYQHFLSEKHWDVTVASTHKGQAKGMLGKSFDVDVLLQDVTATDFHAVLVVGGMGSPEYLWNDETLLHLVRQFHHQNKVVSSICLSGAVLAKSGILEGKRATVWESPESVKTFEDARVQLVREPVVVDGHIVTANGPEAAKAFAHAVSKLVEKLQPAPVS